MGDSTYTSRGGRTNDNGSDLHQKAEVATENARQVPGAGIDIEVFVEIQKI